MDGFYYFLRFVCIGIFWLFFRFFPINFDINTDFELFSVYLHELELF